MIIVAYEGLFGMWGNWVKRGLLDKIHHHTIYRFSWTYQGEVPGCDIVIGHSFGVREALDTARVLRPQLLLLLDPRMPPWGTSEIKAPAGVPTVCVYQPYWRPLPGFPVAGAENIVLKDGTWHTDVPAHARVWEVISRELK